MLRARVWREPVLMNHTRCEARAREWAPDIPQTAHARIIEQRPLPEVPDREFDTEFIAGVVEPRTSDAHVEGFAFAFGASMKKCVAIVFSTSANTPGGSARMGDRLGLAARAIEEIRLRSVLAPGPTERP